jgi:hypothetical protein
MPLSGELPYPDTGAWNFVELVFHHRLTVFGMNVVWSMEGKLLRGSADNEARAWRLAHGLGSVGLEKQLHWNLLIQSLLFPSSFVTSKTLHNRDFVILITPFSEAVGHYLCWLHFS